MKHREYPETHVEGATSIEHIPDELRMVVHDQNGHEDIYMRTGMVRGDFGVQIAQDGRVWICINGLAFLRFSPHPDGKMKKKEPDEVIPPAGCDSYGSLERG